MTDFGSCKSCGRVYSLTRLKACPRCGDAEINSIEEVRIPTTIKKDLTYVRPETLDEFDLTNTNESILPTTTPCKNCGREFRSDKLGSCPRCGYQEQTSNSKPTSSPNQFQSVTESRCVSCSKSFSQAFDFCPSCGAKVKTSDEKQILDKFVMPTKVETHIVKTEPRSTPLSEQRQANSKKVKNLAVLISSIFIILIFGALVLKGISSESPTPTRSDESVDSNQGTSKNVKKCYSQWVPNPAYDPTDFFSNKYYLDTVCQWITINTP